MQRKNLILLIVIIIIVVAFLVFVYSVGEQTKRDYIYNAQLDQSTTLSDGGLGFIDPSINYFSSSIALGSLFIYLPAASDANIPDEIISSKIASCEQDVFSCLDLVSFSGSGGSTCFNALNSAKNFTERLSSENSFIVGAEILLEGLGQSQLSQVKEATDMCLEALLEAEANLPN